ncbi:FAD-dependent oxidoreductase [Planctomycetota bacterium]
MAKDFTKRGIGIMTGVKVEAMEAVGKTVKASIDNGQVLEVDKVLVATGRRPNTADLGLENIGLDTDRGFIRVDDHMSTSVDGTYCIGDANGRCWHMPRAHMVLLRWRTR